MTTNTLPALYEMTAEWAGMVASLERPDADQATILAELERLAGDIRTKAHGLAVVLQAGANKATLIKAEEDRLYALRKRIEARNEWLRAYAVAQMQELGQDRIEAGTFTLSLRTNPPSVEVKDAAAVPSEFTRTSITVDVDKRAILEWFRTRGEVVPGVEIRTDSKRLDVS